MYGLVLVLALLSAMPSSASAAGQVDIYSGQGETEGGGAWLKSDGTVWTWGYNSLGQLGNGTSGDVTRSIVPVQVLTAPGTPLTGVVQIAFGDDQVMARKADGTVWAWGRGGCGELFQGNWTSLSYATQMKLSSGVNITTAVDIDSGEHNYVVLSDGRIMTNLPPGGGCNSYPVALTYDGSTVVNTAVDVAVYGSTVLFRRSDNTAWSAGSNGSGKLGRGVPSSTSSDNNFLQMRFGPAPGTLVTNIAEIAVGGFQSVVRRTDGTVWAAGYDGYGEISNSTVSGDVIYLHRLETSAGVGLTGAAQISAATQQGVYITRTDNTLWGSGQYEHGQQGETSCCSDPVRQRLTNYIDVEGGGLGTTLLVRGDNQAMGTGVNVRGEAGVCHTRPLMAPAAVNTACGAPYSPWRPRYMDVLDSDGSALRCSSVCWSGGLGTTVQVSFSVSDQDTTDTLTPRYQWATTATAFDPTTACTAAGVALTPQATTSSNQDVTINRTETVVHGQQYHVRACTVDSGGRTSGWTYADLWQTAWWSITTKVDVQVDTVDPTAATSVIDGNPTDIDGQTSSTTFVATFAGATDADSGLWGVSYCISTSATGTDCAAGAERTWTSVQSTGMFTATGLTMNNGTRYYVCVRAEDYAKNISAGQTCSDGVVIDSAAPTNPVTRNDGTPGDIDITASTSTLDGNWSAGVDPESGVLNYDYCFTTSSSGANCAAGAQKTWTTTTALSGSATGLTLTHGTTYYMCVRTRDNAGNVAAAACSDGVVVDVSQPTLTLVSPADLATLVSTTPTLTGTFNDADSDTGTITFEVCSDATCATVVSTGSSASTASGANGSWTVGTTLAVSTQYWWRAWAMDVYGRYSPVSVIRSFTTIDGPLVPNARGWNYSSNDWWRNDKNGGSSCPGAVSTIENEFLAIDEDIDSPVSTGCVAGAGQPEADYVQTNVATGTWIDRYELTNAPSAMRALSTLDLRVRGVKTGGKTTTIQVRLYDYSNTLLGTSGPHTLTSTETSFSTSITGLTQYATDVDGMWVELQGDISGGGGGSDERVTAINVDLGTMTTTSGTKPSAPTLVSPANGGLVGTTPTLTATFQDPDVGNTGTIRYEICANAACAGPRPDMRGTSASGTAIGANGTYTTPALTIGTTYYWRARGRDQLGNEGAWSAWRSFTVDGPPAAPASVNDGTGADIAWTATAGQLSANWSAVGDADLNRYEYCISATTNCGGTPIASWTSTVLATSVTRTGLTLTPGTTYYTCVRTVDNQSNVSTSMACSNGQTFHRAPNVPTLVSPANAATGQALAPTLTVGYSDLDAHTGTVSFQVCSDAACSSVVRSGSSAVTTSGTSATWVVSAALAANTLYYWRAMATDTPGASSAWSTPTWSFTTANAPTITDSQTGDLTWRNTNSGTYNVDFSDGVSLANFETTVWSGLGQTGTQRQAWTQVATISGASYTTNWALLASTWTAMAEGINYVSVRVTNTNAMTTSSTDTFEVRKDTVVPNTVSTLAASSPTLSVPALTWTTVTDATSGVAYYRVYRGTSSTGPWTQVSTDGVTTTGAFTDSGAAFGTHWYKVQAVDQAGNEAAASNVVSVLYHRAPGLPVLVSPTNASTGIALAPTLTASYSDPDAHTGTMSFQVCNDSACSSVARSGTSASTASGANATWVVSPALASATTYWFRAMATDANGATSAWTATWSFTTANLPSIIDNQAGDLTWRNTNSGTYNVDFSDGVGLANFETNVWSGVGQTGTQRQAWTQVATISGASYTTDWALLASTWTAMAEGINYVSVRVTNTNALSSTSVDTFEVRKDTVAAPAVGTLATSSPTTTAPALTWTTVTDATSGVAYYRVYRGPSGTGPWTLVSTDGSVTTGAFTDAGASVNATHHYKVQAVDQAGNESVASNTVSAYYHRVPSTTLVSPANAATGISPLPVLTATHTDLDGHTGTISFEVCSDAACTGVVRTGSSAAGIASGANGTHTIASALAQGTTYWWRARSTDSQGAVGAWTGTWSFTTSTGPTITDNQAGDATWRSTNSGTYDVDFSDTLGLDRFEVQVWSGVGGTGSLLQNWTLVTGSLAGTTYTTNWALPASTWTAMQQGVNYVSVRAYNDAAGLSTLMDAFEVRKDTAAAAPGAVNDGPALDVDWWASTSSLDMNWSASAGETGLSGVLRYEYCISTVVACGGTPLRSWTNAGTGTSVTALTLGMTNGTQYFVAMRMLDNAGNTSVATSSDAFRVDATAPTAPTLVTPAAAAVLTASPTLTATYNDPAPASPGQLTFEVCSDATCSAVVDTGTSATGIAAGANGSWTPAALTGGSYWWRARGTDSALTNGAWSATRAFTLTYPPTAPTLVSPANGVWTADDTPTLTATFNDPDAGATGQLTFELCATSPADPWSVNCASGYQTGTSAAGIAEGTNGTFTAAAIPNGATRSWRVRGNDGTSNSVWSVVRTVRVDTAPPPAVTTTSGPSPTTSAPALTWTTVTDAESGTAFYRVYRSTSAGTLGSQVNVDGATTTGSYTDSTVTNGGYYFYTVRAVDNVGNEQLLGNTQASITFTAPLYLRSSVLAGTTEQDLTVTPGSGGDLSTVVQNRRNTGFMMFQSGSSYQPAGGGTPPAGVTTNGWLFDAGPDSDYAAGSWEFYVTTDVNRAYDGRVAARAWRVQRSGGTTGEIVAGTAVALMPWTYDAATQSTFTGLQTRTISATLPQVTLAANEYLYVEYGVEVGTDSGFNNGQTDFRVETSTERIVTPPPPPAMSVTSTNPASLAQGRRNVVVRVNGTGFVSGATVAFAGTGITIDSTTFVSATAIDVQVDIDDAATLGARDVTVTNPDLSTATGTGAFTVTAPTITIGFSTLGYTDLVRDTSAPHDIGFGLLSPGAVRTIGPGTSGQAAAGAAIETTVTSDTDSVLQVAATAWGGTATMPVSQLAWKHFGVVESWTAMSTTATTSDGPTAPGTTTHSHDLQLTVPPGQQAGSYSATVTYTAIAAP